MLLQLTVGAVLFDPEAALKAGFYGFDTPCIHGWQPGIACCFRCSAFVPLL
jgi:hypothetical protein